MYLQIIYIGYFIIHGTTNNSSDNNAVFFFVSDFEIVYHNNY